MDGIDLDVLQGTLKVNEHNLERLERLAEYSPVVNTVTQGG